MMKKMILTAIVSLLLPMVATAQTFNEMEYTPEQTTFRLFAPVIER